ncbi:MAG TPA: transcription antitermination factor NusB [Myxococcota bacterium]|nr:transcription antitermination factor NusB [Myxococcota bacterium]
MANPRQGSRRQARIYALQALYHADHAQLRATQALQALWQSLLDGEGIDGERGPESDEIEFAQRLVRGVEEHGVAIDALIEQCSTNWRLRRMPVVDRNILRVAAFELMRCDDIPATVSINEAVELAKLFGTDDSRAFVNGIVDRIGRQVGRLPEGARRRRDEG